MVIWPMSSAFLSRGSCLRSKEHCRAQKTVSFWRCGHGCVNRDRRSSRDMKT